MESSVFGHASVNWNGGNVVMIGKYVFGVGWNVGDDGGYCW